MTHRVRSRKSGYHAPADSSQRGPGASLLLAAALWLPIFGCEGTIDEGPDRGPESMWPTNQVPFAPGASPTGGSAPLPSTAAADDAMRAANADLFSIAETYFPETTAAASPSRLFRLTRTQIDRTTQALLPMQYQDAAAKTMPRDPLQTNYEYAENLSFNAANFTPYTGWVEQLSNRVRMAPTSVIACAGASPDRVCLEQQAKKFVALAFRSTVDDAQVQRFSTFFLSSVAEVGLPDAVADLVTLTLTSSHYVFRDEVALNGAELSPAQQLQNISYTLADAPPDALGFTSANAQSYFATTAMREQTIDTVLKAPAARQKLLRFFMSWLEVREPEEFGLAPDVFPEFTPTVAAAAVEEVRAFLEHQLAAATPRLPSVTQSTESFISDAIAPLYGAKRGSTALTPLDPKQRLGIFTLPGVIASHSGPTTTRLIKRGVFFTRKVMCLPLGLPPPGVNTTLPEMQGATERQRVESATASTTCQGCHSVINPFGFMQENYDAMGRWRTTDQGSPIDASMKFNLLDEGPLMTSSPIEAFRSLTNSMRFQQCFARQLFRFYMGRDEKPGDDPTLRQMFFGFANQGSQDIGGMLQTLAKSTSFSQRSEARP
jgi:hypothetical protein